MDGPEDVLGWERIESVREFDFTDWQRFQVGDYHEFLGSMATAAVRGLDFANVPGFAALPTVLSNATCVQTLRRLAFGGRSGVRFRWGDADNKTLDLVALNETLALARLESLTAFDCGLTTDGLTWLLAAAWADELRALDVSDNHIAPDAWRAFRAAKCRLDRLDVSGTSLAGISLEPLLDAPSLERLTKLEMNRCGSARRTMEMLAGSPFWTQADQLRAHSGTIPASTLEPLCRSAGPQRLLLLDLADNYFRTEGVRMLCDAPWVGSLTWLALSRNYLDDEALVALAECGRFTKLRTLHLAHNNTDQERSEGEQITDRGVATLASAPSLSRLCVLSLSYTGVTHRSVDQVLNAPSWRLFGIGLAGCDLSPEAIETLAYSPRLTRLSWLDLGFNPRLSGSALRPLAESPYLSRLCELDVRGVYLDDVTRAALRARLGPRLSDWPWVSPSERDKIRQPYVAARGRTMPTPADEQTFLAPILARYAEDGPRLVYADFLDESDDPADQARGELIRVQCALARMADDHPRRPEFVARQSELLQTYQARWTDHLSQFVLGVEFRRGLPDVVAVNAGTFLSRGDQLFRRANVRRVRLLDAARHLSRLAACPHLALVRELDMSGNELGNGGVNVLLRSPYLGSIEVLDLSFNGLCDGGVRLIARSPVLSQLRTLSLTDNGQISGEGLRLLAGSQHLGGLRELDVSGNDVNDAGVQAVVESHTLARLHTFRVYANHIGDAGAAVLAGSALLDRMLARNPRLDLRQNAIGPAGAQALATSERLRNVAGLDLSGNYLGDAGLAALANSPYLTKLRALAVRQNQISDAGAMALARSPLMSRLQSVDMSSNRLTRKGADALWNQRRDWRTEVEVSDNLIPTGLLARGVPTPPHTLDETVGYVLGQILVPPAPARPTSG